MTRWMQVFRVGLEAVALIEKAIAENRTWLGTRKAVADAILAGDLDRAIQFCRGARDLVREYVHNG